MKEPEETDSLLEGFKDLIGDIVPAVATAAVEPSIKTAQKQWAADLSSVAEKMQAQLDASLLSIESTFASVSQQLSATADGFENAVSSEKQGLWQALGEFRQETERIAAELTSFSEAAQKAVSESETFTACRRRKTRGRTGLTHSRAPFTTRRSQYTDGCDLEGHGERD
jgi:hypothetical protein